MAEVKPWLTNRTSRMSPTANRAHLIEEGRQAWRELWGNGAPVREAFLLQKIIRRCDWCGGKPAPLGILYPGDRYLRGCNRCVSRRLDPNECTLAEREG